jgi:hypothetical protein
MRTAERFESYKSHILKHFQRESISWTIELQLERQTKLDEWREYYLYHLSRLRSIERRAGDQSQPPKNRNQAWSRDLIKGRLGMVMSASTILQEMEAEHARANPQKIGKRKTTRGPVRRSERLKNRPPQNTPKLPQRSGRVSKSRKKPNAGSQTRRRLDSLDAYRSAESS